ncbi:hypothetical protein BJ508DRAFT_334162 [Ascobolus immersus RN42]|uniref:Uncharacterized protein n=1 Tax=Ascobolus immersus RN42 TaxID=1160509 RepID=A0A3N4HH05_ASCIM|nr:hypothetical protein BJ508DRAFT_334162 [Ascobolus immersus RN42]
MAPIRPEPGRTIYEQKLDKDRPKHHWCNQYRSAKIAAGQITWKPEHVKYFPKFQHHTGWYGAAEVDGKKRYEWGEQLLREIGGCTPEKSYKCQVIGSRMAEKMARHGEVLRASHKLVPVLDAYKEPTGYEKLASQKHARDLCTVDFLNQHYTVDTLPDLVDILRAYFPVDFDAEIKRRPGLEAEREERVKRRAARSARNRRAKKKDPKAELEPDTEAEVIKDWEDKNYITRNRAFFLNPDTEHYAAPEFVDDEVDDDKYGAGIETDGEELNKQKGKKQGRK